MISSIAWVPAGVANPNPQKYELSAVEQELIQLMQQKGNIEEQILLEQPDHDRTRQIIKLPKIKNELPADLRMDEYSSDEDEETQAMGLGKVLLADTEEDAALMEDEEEVIEADDDDDDGLQAEQLRQKVGNDEHNDSDDDDDDDDDDLADIPDTREFMPLDVEGLEAMGLSHGGTMMYEDDDDDDESEAEDVRLTEDDAIILVAKTEEDFASLEVHVYDQVRGSLYVHHDIPLPSFPLCLAHGQVSSNGTTGNFCAVGSFSPGIEIWNLDVLNALEPSCILGGEDTSAADDLMKLQLLNAGKGGHLTSRPKSSSSGLRPGSHTDAVMALSWNPFHKQVIASGSADATVKLWDVTKAGTKNYENCNASTFTHHSNKVQAVAWNPKEGTLLASGSFDRTVSILDARSSGSQSNVKSVKIKADCEALAWDPFHSERLTVVTEDGTICCWDVRKFETLKPLWSFTASEFGGVNDLCYNPQVPGLMVTCSIDKHVSLWDTHVNQGETKGKVWSSPRLCGQKDMCVGKLYSVSFYPSSPWLLGCGGSGNQLALWDMSSEGAIQERFQSRMTGDENSKAVDIPDQNAAEDLKALITPTSSSDVSSSNQQTAKSDNRMTKKGKSKSKIHKKSR